MRSTTKGDLALLLGLVVLFAGVAFIFFGPGPTEPIFTYTCPVGRVNNPDMLPEVCRNNGNPANQ